MKGLNPIMLAIVVCGSLTLLSMFPSCDKNGPGHKLVAEPLPHDRLTTESGAILDQVSPDVLGMEIETRADLSGFTIDIRLAEDCHCDGDVFIWVNRPSGRWYDCILGDELPAIAVSDPDPFLYQAFIPRSAFGDSISWAWVIFDHAHPDSPCASAADGYVGMCEIMWIPDPDGSKDDFREE